MRQPHRNWTLIRQEYESNPISLRELAKKHNLNASYIFRRSSKEHWVKYIPSVAPPPANNNSATLANTIRDLPATQAATLSQNDKLALAKNILSKLAGNRSPNQVSDITFPQAKPTPPEEWNPLDSP